jgi:hypothetical protein
LFGLPGGFLLLYALFFTFTGLNQLSFGTIQGKLIRPDRRGRLISLAGTVGSIPAILCAWFLLPRWLAMPEVGFGYVFGFTGIGFVAAGLMCLAVVELADHPHVIGLKDSTGDLGRLYKGIDRTPDSFAVLQGSTVCGVPSLDLGADGIVAGEANVDPAALATVYDAYAAGDRERAVDRLNERVFPINDAITDVPTIPALKHLAGRTAGFDLGPPLPPLPELMTEQRETVERVL